MSSLKNVVLVGGSGLLGTQLLKTLLAAKQFNVSVLQRNDSSATFPADINVLKADVSSVESVTEAFKGQDAVVSAVGRSGMAGGGVLVEAALAAGVKRFVPSDYGPDLSNPLVTPIPLFEHKVAVHKILRAANEKRADFTYSLLCTNTFFEYGIRNNFLLAWAEGKPKFFDGGDSVFSTCKLETVADAITGILQHPDETSNRFLYVSDIDLTQRRLLELAKEVAPEKQWDEPIQISTEAMEKSADEAVAAGKVTPPVYISYLIRVIFGPAKYGSHFKNTDNALLGIKGIDEAEVKEILKTFLVKA